MKKVNGMTVYEPEDPCALDEYSEQLEKDLTAKFDEIKNENEQESTDILILQNKVTNLEKETEEQQGQITELQNKVNVLEDQIPNGQSTGNPIHIADSTNLEAKLRLNGGDKQETREGYNLLDTSKLSTGTSNGIEKQINKENGKIILNGTTTLLTNCWIDNLNKTLVPGTYKFITDFDLILNSENIGAYVIKDVDGNNILQTRQSAEFVLEKETILNQVLIQINKGVKLDKQEIGLMIISGTENKNYEQYGAMPSPNYASKVETVGSNINIFDKSASPIYVAGSTATEIENGIRIATISSNQGLFCLYKIKDITNFKGKTFTVKANWIASASNKGRIILGLCDSNRGNRISGVRTDNSGEAISYTIPDTLSTSTYLALWLYANSSGTTQAGDYVDYTDIKIEEGDKATAYSPYNMGSVEIDVCNKNFLKFIETDKTQSGLDVVASNNSIEVNGTSTASINLFNVFEDIKLKKGTYTFSFKAQNPPPANSTQFILCKEDGSRITTLNAWGSTNSNAITLEEDTFISSSKSYFYANKNITFSNTKYELQIEKGESATEIIKPQSQTKIMPIQQELLEGDYIEDVEHHGWGKVILDGENIKFVSKSGTSNNMFVTQSISKFKKPVTNSEKINMLSNYFKAESTNNIYANSITGINIRVDKQICVGFGLDSTINTIELANEWLKEHNVIAYAPLETPIDLELTEEQKEAKKINTYNNVTNIVADNELATLDVTYKKDQNTVNQNYENRIAALEAAILS